MSPGPRLTHPCWPLAATLAKDLGSHKSVEGAEASRCVAVAWGDEGHSGEGRRRREAPAAMTPAHCHTRKATDTHTPVHTQEQPHTCPLDIHTQQQRHK